jgi:hypothetical protein
VASQVGGLLWEGIEIDSEDGNDPEAGMTGRLGR